MVVDDSGSYRGGDIRGGPVGAVQHGEERIMMIIVFVIILMIAAATGFLVGVAYGQEQEHRER